MTVQGLGYLAFVGILWLAALATRRMGTRQALFLVASYAFYVTWGLGFLATLIATSLINFAYGGFLRRDPNAKRLAGGIAVNVAVLSFFKYLPPLADALSGSSVLRIAIPIGISFWVFQAISYLFDIYREEEIAPSIVEFLLYMAFFPTVLSGPVCRMPEMLPQFRSAERPAWDDVRLGTTRILIGLSMKLVLAHLLGVGFNPGEGAAYGFGVVAKGAGGLDVWILAVAFGFELFFDFAGYSNIVIGVARLFGIRLRENFEEPFLSTTPSVFWTRWHMSLSFWIRDYVFLPLATLRRGRSWREFALATSMVVFGLWHGATVLFLLWGLYHGLLLAGHREFERVQKRRGWRTDKGFGAFVGWGVTFGLVSLGWILFRANSLFDAVHMFRAVLTPTSYLHVSLRPNFVIITVLLSSGYFAFVWAARLLGHLRRNRFLVRAQWLLAPVGWAIILLGVIIWSGNASNFIYFQF